MNQIIKMLLGLSLFGLGIVEEGKGGLTPENLADMADDPEANADEEVKEQDGLDLSKIKSWAEEGKKAGVRIAELLAKGESILRETLLKYAPHLAGTPSAEDWLTGFSMAFEAEQTRKNRKSEAKAVFACWTSNHEVKMVDTSTAEKLALARAGTPEHDVKTSRERMLEFKGGYHAFMQLVRDMAPKATSAASNTGTQRVKTLSDKAAAKVVEQLGSATGVQADKVMGAAIAALKRQPGFEHKMFGQIVGLCNEIKAASKDDRMLDAVARIIDVVAEITTKQPGTGTVQSIAPASIPAPAAASTEIIPAAQQKAA